MKKELVIPISLLIAGELAIFSSNSLFYGLVIHTVNLAITNVTILRSSLELKTKNILRFVILVILLNMINLSFPQFFSVNILRYLFMYSIMLIPIYYIIKDKLILFNESGIVDREFYIYLSKVLVAWLVVIVIQYEMFNTLPLDVIYTGGEFTAICLIISIIITLLSFDTKYWNEYISDTLDMTSNSLLPVFITIVIYKIMPVI